MIPVALVSSIFLVGSVPPDRPAVMLSTDCGASIDDQWALAHLALSPEIDLRGIVTSHAPNLTPPAAETSVLAVLDRLPRGPRPRLVRGSDRPLADRAHPLPNVGVSFLIEQARGHTAGHRLTVVMIGAATDVASALLIDPTLADRVAIVAMGFEGWPDGDDPWNVRNDVAAWQVVLDSRAPIVVGDLAVTGRQLVMSRARAHTLLDDRAEPGPFLASLLSDWLDAHGQRDDLPIWDEVTVAYLLGLTTVATHPRPALGVDLKFDHSRTQGTIDWITSIDDDRLWTDLARKLGQRP